MDDVALADEPVIVRARPSESRPRLHVRLSNRASGETHEEVLSRAAGGWQQESFQLASGVWRISVGGEGVAPVSDLAVVAAP
jgi:hypothetical protein